MRILNSGSFTPGGVNILGLLNLAMEAMDPTHLWQAIHTLGQRLNELDFITPETQAWVRNFQNNAIGDWAYEDMDGDPWDPILAKDGFMDYHRTNGTMYSFLIFALLLTQAPKMLNGLALGVKKYMSIKSKRKTAAFRDETLSGIDQILAAIGDDLVLPNKNTARIEELTQALKSNNTEHLFSPLGRLRV